MGSFPGGRRWAWIPASAGRASVHIVAGERRHVIRLWSQKRVLAAVSAHSPVPGEPQEEGSDVSPLLWEQRAAGPRSGNYPSRLAWKLWASASRTRLRRRPHRLPLQRPSSTMTPTSALVAVSAGMTVSLTLLALLGPLLVSIHDNSRRGGQLRIGNVHRGQGLRSPPDDWERTAVNWRTTQSS